jgi:hypothetical protein
LGTSRRPTRPTRATRDWADLSLENDLGCLGGGQVRIEGSDRHDGDGATDELAATKPGTDAGAMPANVSENILAMVMAGFAKLAELVKK